MKPAFSLETSDIFVEIDTVYLLFCDLHLFPFVEFALSFDTFAKVEIDTVYLLFCDLNQKI